MTGVFAYAQESQEMSDPAWIEIALRFSDFETLWSAQVGDPDDPP